MTPAELASRILAAAGSAPLRLYTPANQARILDAATASAKELFILGFSASGEGYNAEYPFEGRDGGHAADVGFQSVMAQELGIASKTEAAK